MKTLNNNGSPRWLPALIVLAGVFVTAYTTQAHCDRVNGPVAVAAKTALQSANIDEVLIWVGAEQEEELESSYEQALSVYREGGDARALAERYFMENTVRLHRQAEGMPYTGLKPAQRTARDIRVAEQALDTGQLDPVTALLAEEMEKKASELFQNVREASERKDESVAAGRKWADAYVQYIVYVHGLHAAIQAGPAHGVGE